MDTTRASQRPPLLDLLLSQADTQRALAQTLVYASHNTGRPLRISAKVHGHAHQAVLGSSDAGGGEELETHADDSEGESGDDGSEDDHKESDAEEEEVMVPKQQSIIGKSCVTNAPKQPTANGGAIEASAVACPLPDVVVLPQSTHPTNAVEQLNCWPKETLSYDQSRSIGTGTMGLVYKGTYLT
ncbi:hypothetical protein Pelo_18367 [Pelomyxa schiedti]|nr:hypothetical protein Pelo_18367 [Pelomyxa schiedti]